MDRARKSFKQYRYEKDSKIIDYNFYIPENISKDDYYPLVVFISDRSLVGQEITAPLTKTVGGPIWATDTVQKKHKCFVLVPQYNETISTMETKSEYVNVTIGLIQEIQDEYNIDKKRIYGTGQSMGAMVLLYYLANHPYLYTAGLIVDGHWELEELHGLVNATFTYFAAEGDPNPYKCQNEVREFFNSSGVIYQNMDRVDAQAKVENLNNITDSMYNLTHSYNFITYKNGSVFPPNTKRTIEHMASFKYGYRIDTVRDWIFKQNRVKCPEGYYYSEDGKCSDTNFCKVTRKDMSCKECIYGYYLTSDRTTCSKDPNCESANKTNGECNSCAANYYLDKQEKKMQR